MKHHSILGFTLAECLITLGIIGIVAALTLPSFISEYKEKVTVTKLKKMYSVLSSAYELYKIDNTPVKIPFTSDGAVETFKIFEPHLKILKDCTGKGYNSACLYSGTYNKLNGSPQSSYNSSQYYKVLLADGSSLVFRGGEYPTDKFHIFYDVNGTARPNTWGKDLFEFGVYDDNNMLAPNGIQKRTSDCGSLNAAGWGCTFWIIHNENMDYLHCDGLSWNGAKSCKELK